MASPAEIQAALARVHDQASLVNELLANTLEWPLAEKTVDVGTIAFGWSTEDLRAQELDKHLLDGQIWQIQPFRDGQPWGIFLVEFANDKIYRTKLRQVLRGLVPNRRRDPRLQAWQHDNLLFICATRDYQRITFAHFRGEQAQTARLALFGWDQDDPRLRTLCEFNLPALTWPDDDRDADHWLKSWTKAFDKEPLTKDFFRRFDRSLEAIQRDLEKYQNLNSADAYSKAQLLLERLIFLYFLQNRGWLDQKRDYLPKAFAPFSTKPGEFSFYAEFLEKLFWTLASAPGPGNRFSGIPFLNGGLFDDDEFDPAKKKHNPPLKITNGTFTVVFNELLEAFNFTVREDTPLDQDVAVDPEMLGKVFESIVLHAEAADPDAIAPDKRKATGSYYTPRIVVHFICREALYQYFRNVGQAFQPDSAGANSQAGKPDLHDWPRRLRALLEMDAANGLSGDNLKKLRELLSAKEGAALAAQLKDLKCCDPAVGSGAFPVGLLHELVNFRRVVETAANGYVDPIRKRGATWLHDTKEQIVQDCLFGVDIQQQAIEICRLRLWLSLVVDYDLGVDPFQAERKQFLDAIGKMSQLPNLEMNFHRGDSLLDLIADVPVRLGLAARGMKNQDVKDLHSLETKLHREKSSSKKKALRVEILRKRLAVTAAVLQRRLDDLAHADAPTQAELFGKGVTNKERGRRLGHETAEARRALLKVQADQKELEKLATQEYMTAGDFYAKLRRLEGADFNSPFNFAWRLDFAPIFDRDPPGFDIIVGNPPFVTARNPKKRELYRERWSRVCSSKYHMLCPFFDLSFDVLRAGGELGFIVSNAFAKREFGQPLIEVLFAQINLQKVVDCSGLLFPGHGTPTCLVFAENRVSTAENGDVRVVGILPGGGDLRTPPEDSTLWTSISWHHDSPGYCDERVAVVNRSAADMAKWPWSFDVGAIPTRQLIDKNAFPRLLEQLGGSIGFDAISAANDIYYVSGDFIRRIGIPVEFAKHLLVGEMLRNYQAEQTAYTIWPYSGEDAKPKLHDAVRSLLAPFRPYLEIRSQFRKTQLEAGLNWFEFREYHRRALVPQLTYADVATHLHVVFSDGDRVFNQHAPVIEAPAKATEEAFLRIAAIINSSTALFWLKQICFNKGAGEEEERDRFEFAGGKIEQLPVPFAEDDASLVGKRLAAFSRLVSSDGKKLESLAMRKLYEDPKEAYHTWNASLPRFVVAAELAAAPFRHTNQLASTFTQVIEVRERLRSQMIARQEEMDWLVYAAYGLLPEDAPAVGIKSPLPDAELILAREQRPFCLWAAAGGDFAKAAELIPAAWSAAKKKLWRARLEAIRDNEHIRRIEQPVYKRRWDEQYKIGNRWECGQPGYDAEFLDAFDWWLSEKAEWWLEHPNKNQPIDLDAWTKVVWEDLRVQAAWPVVLETKDRLHVWKILEKERRDAKTAVDAAPAEPPGRRLAPFAEFARYFKKLVKEQAVPDDIPFAVPWAELEKSRKIPAAVKSIRGKLNVPRERFRVTKDGKYCQADL